MVSLPVLPQQKGIMKITEKEFLKTISEIAQIEDKRICVALSGGMDSVCLLHAFSVIKNSVRFHLCAVHVNHNLRGVESKRDEEFCVSLCSNMGIPIKIFNIDVEGLKKKGESIEEAARRLRYDSFEKIDCDFIATAHNADDSLETFLINFIRGTGLKGLCGIPKIRGRFIRPLLAFSKNDILRYIKENNLDYVTDSSNFEDDYLRNKIRHKIIPEIKSISPSICDVSLRNFQILKSDNDFLEDTAKKCYDSSVKGDKLQISSLKNLNNAILSRVIKNFCSDTVGFSPDKKHTEEIEKIILLGSGRRQLKNGYFAQVKSGVLTIKKINDTSFSVETQIMPVKNFYSSAKINNLLLKNAVDYDKIVGKLNVRTRNSNDSIKPVGRGITKKLRKLQSELGIELSLREKMPVAADDKGVIWAYEIGTDERVAVDSKTKNVLIFYVNASRNKSEENN